MAQKKTEDTQKVQSGFVIGPIGQSGTPERTKADWLLKGVIKPVLEGLHSVEIRRSDEIPTPGMIDSQVINRIFDADIVIADLTDLNVNAFYEMAIRHVIGKPVIHMVDSGTPIPFDVRPYRTIVFDLTEFDGMERAKKELDDQVKDVFSEKHTADNPVLRARGKVKLEENATDFEKILRHEIDDLQKQVYEVRNEIGRSQARDLQRARANRMGTGRRSHQHLMIECEDPSFAEMARDRALKLARRSDVRARLLTDLSEESPNSFELCCSADSEFSIRRLVRQIDEELPSEITVTRTK